MEKKLEKDIQREICDWLYSKGVFFWRENTIPVFQRDNRGARFRAMPKYAIKGLPDIMCVRDARFIGLEVKRPNRNTGDRASKYAATGSTPAQLSAAEKIRANGGFYHIVTSLAEAIDIMKFYGV